MKQKTYRRLTTGLFLFLFLVFVLLYLLLSGNASWNGGKEGDGNDWSKLHKELGVMRISETRSGGFITKEMPLEQSTSLSAPDFDDHVVRCTAQVYNEGTVPVKVDMKVYGTKLTDTDQNQGLSCALYYHTGENDPVGSEGFAAFVSADGAYRPTQSQQLKLYLDETNYPLQFTLKPGETMYLNLCFWVEEAVVPYLTDETAQGYSATVKLTSRSLE